MYDTNESPASLATPTSNNESLILPLSLQKSKETILGMTLVKASILLSPLQLLEKKKNKAAISKIHSYVDYKAFLFWSCQVAYQYYAYDGELSCIALSMEIGRDPKMI